MKSVTPPSSRFEAGDLDDLQEVGLVDEPLDFESQRSSRPACFRSLFHEITFAVFGAFTAASLPCLLRATLVLVETIRQDLQGDFITMAWMPGCSALAAGVVLVPFTVMFDHCNLLSPKAMLLGSVMAYSAAVFGLSWARTPTCFLVLCGVCGVTCAAHLTTIFRVVYAAYHSPTSPSQTTAVYTAVLAGGHLAEMLIGGLGPGFTAVQFGWRAAFRLLSAVYLFMAMLGVYAVPDVSLESEKADFSQAASRSTMIRTTGAARVDWWSLCLISSGLPLIMMGFMLGPSYPEWRNARVISSLAIGGLLLVLFSVRQILFSKSPVLPLELKLVTQRHLDVVCTFFAAMGCASCLYWLSVRFQVVQGLDPAQTAIRLLPQSAAALLVAPLTGPLVRRVPKLFVLTWIFQCQVAVSMLLGNGIARHDGGYFSFAFPALILSGLGMETALALCTDQVTSALPLRSYPRGLAATQTMCRWAVPAALGVTTAVWSTLVRDPTFTPSGTAYAFAFNFYLAIPLAIVALLLALPTVFKANPATKAPEPDDPKESGQRYSDSTESCASEKPAAGVGRAKAALNGDAGVWRGAQIGPRSPTHAATVACLPVGPDGSPLSRPTADDTHISTPAPEVPTPLGGRSVGSRPAVPLGDPESYFDEEITAIAISTQAWAAKPSFEATRRKFPLGTAAQGIGKPSTTTC